MPTISKPCVDSLTVLTQEVNYGSFKGQFLNSVLHQIQDRIRFTPYSIDSIIHRSSSDNSLTSQTKILKYINSLKRELNATFELEKKDGMELSQEDKDMIYMLDNTIPDMILNMCQQKRNLNDFNNMGGGKRKTKRSRKNKRTRKHRKV